MDKFDRFRAVKKRINLGCYTSDDLSFLIQTVEQQQSKLDFWKSHGEELLKIEGIHIKQLQEKDAEIERLKDVEERNNHVIKNLGKDPSIHWVIRTLSGEYDIE